MQKPRFIPHLTKGTRFIAHVDMDAFFAAIEQRDNPQFRGKPVVVGADPKAGRGRGVVSTCSYEARKFGIHSAMPISIAYRMCPDAIFLPVNMDKYEAVSSQIYKILYDFTPDIEPVGIDEAFLDITGSCHLFGASTPLPSTSLGMVRGMVSPPNHSTNGEQGRTIGTPLDTCLLIKYRIKLKTALTASIGLAPTKMAAKIASDLKKPDGMVEVTEEGLLEFLRPLSVRKIWGLGEKAEKLLNDIGIYTIGDLAKTDRQELIALFGKVGEDFWQLANGIDPRPVETETEAKSISNEVTFDTDTLDRDKIEAALISLSEKVSDRLRQQGLKGRTITLKIRLQGFQTYTRAFTIDRPTNFTDVIYDAIKKLYANFDTKGKKVRLVGVKISNLVPIGFHDDLFKGYPKEKKGENVHKAIDKIKARFGEDSIYRAAGKYL